MGNFVKLAATLGPLGAVAVAWIYALYGRKCLKVGENGEIEVEAQTVRQVEKLVSIADALQKRNQPRAIHEP